MKIWFGWKIGQGPEHRAKVKMLLIFLKMIMETTRMHHCSNVESSQIQQLKKCWEVEWLVLWKLVIFLTIFLLQHFAESMKNMQYFEKELDQRGSDLFKDVSPEKKLWRENLYHYVQEDLSLRILPLFQTISGNIVLISICWFIIPRNYFLCGNIARLVRKQKKKQLAKIKQILFRLDYMLWPWFERVASYGSVYQVILTLFLF